MPDPWLGTSILERSVEALFPAAKYVGGGMGVETDARRDVQFSIEPDGAGALALHLSHYGLDDVAIDGETFAGGVDRTVEHDLPSRAATQLEIDVARHEAREMSQGAIEAGRKYGLEVNPRIAAANLK
jgi:hypothetical protein